MPSSDIKARTDLFAILDSHGSAWVLNATANWIGGNASSGKETKKLKNRKASPKTKAGLLEAIREKYPDWNLGKGKGISVSELKSSLDSGVKPEKKKRSTPYFNFLAIVRAEVKDMNLNPQQIIRIGSRRWTILKKFASENGHSTIDIVESEKLLTKAAENYNTIEKDLEGLEKPVVRKSKKTKKTVKKIKKNKEEETEEDEDNSNNANIMDEPVAGMFDMSDSDDDDSE
jgi:hypothetical protein